MIPTTLRSVTIADDSEAITDNAFSGLGMVEEFIIPNTVTTIGDYAFYGCRSIKSINLESITSIGNNAFNGCVNLENISFGKALEYIGDKALFATKYLNLKDDVQFVILDDILIQYNGTDTNVTIPSQVKAISGGAFSGNQTVTEITLSSNTKLLCNGAFDSCSKLSKITIPYDGVVEIELGVFDTLSSNLKIYVKNGKLNEYKNDIHWSLYEDYLA